MKHRTMKAVIAAVSVFLVALVPTAPALADSQGDQGGTQNPAEGMVYLCSVVSDRFVVPGDRLDSTSYNVETSSVGDASLRAQWNFFRQPDGTYRFENKALNLWLENDSWPRHQVETSGNAADDDAQWTLEDAGDGTFYFVNNAYGSQYSYMTELASYDITMAAARSEAARWYAVDVMSGETCNGVDESGDGTGDGTADNDTQGMVYICASGSDRPLVAGGFIDSTSYNVETGAVTDTSDRAQWNWFQQPDGTLRFENKALSLWLENDAWPRHQVETSGNAADDDAQWTLVTAGDSLYLVNDAYGSSYSYLTEVGGNDVNMTAAPSDAGRWYLVDIMSGETCNGVDESGDGTADIDTEGMVYICSWSGRPLVADDFIDHTSYNVETGEVTNISTRAQWNWYQQPDGTLRFENKALSLWLENDSWPREQVETSGNAADDDAQWTLVDAGDGAYYFVNDANGSPYSYMTLVADNDVNMTASQSKAARWTFVDIMSNEGLNGCKKS